MPLANPNLLFVHIPKCGGTSIEVALGIADRYPSLGLERTATRPDINALFGGGLQHLSAREIATHFPRKIVGTFKFAVVRDPVDRFLSFFLWKHYMFTEANKITTEMVQSFYQELDFLHRFSRQHPLFEEPYIGLTYCEGTAAEALHPDNILRHLLPQCCYIYNRDIFFMDDIYLIEQMPDLSETLSRRLSREVNIPNRMVSPLRAELCAFLDEPTRAMVRNVYKHDNELVERLRGGSRPCLGEPRRSHSAAAAARPRQDKTIPRKLWIYWDQGWQNAPFLVQKCIESWIAHNGDTWSIQVLDRETMHEFAPDIGDYDVTKIPIAAFSDILRIKLLRNHGGVWADATTWCARPLDDWIDEATRSSGFFAYAKPGPDRPLASWLLAAAKENLIVRRWAQRVEDVWQPSGDDHETPRNAAQDEYFWFHKIFSTLIETDPDVAALWSTVPEISADGPHYLQRIGLLEKADDDVYFHIRGKISNVYKLHRKTEIAPEDDLGGTVIGALLRSLR